MRYVKTTYLGSYWPQEDPEREMRVVEVQLERNGPWSMSIRPWDVSLVMMDLVLDPLEYPPGLSQ